MSDRTGTGRRAALALALLAAACGGGERAGVTRGGGEAGPGAPADGGTAVICEQAQPESLDPFLSPELVSSDLSALLFTPLATYGDKGDLVPVMAEGWAWTDDHRQLDLRLRPDLRWHDGVPVRAEDVAWTLRTAADPAYGSWLVPDLGTLDDAEATDSLTVRVAFSEPFRAGLEPLLSIPVLPAHLLADLGPDEFARAPYHREPVGSGPFRFVSRAGDGTIAFERNPDYPEELAPIHLDRILFRPIPEPATMAATLRAGETQACVVGSSATSALLGIDGVDLRPVAPPSVLVLVLNGQHPPLDDPRVRRALSAALRRSEVANVISTLARPALGPLPPGDRWLDPVAAQPDDAPRTADSLFAQAGWKRGPGPVRTNAAGEELRLVVAAPPQLETPLTAIQAMWAEAGVGLEIRAMEWASYVRLLQNAGARTDVMALTFTPDPILRPDFSGTYRSDSPRNLASFASAGMDEVLARLDTASTPESLGRLYGELQEIVATEVPIVYVAWAPRVLAVSDRLQDVESRPGSPFFSVGDWWMEGRAR